MTTSKQIVLKKHDGSEYAAYLELWHHPHDVERCGGIVRKTVSLADLIEGYSGPRIAIDFDRDDNPIGIEILYPYGNDAPFEKDGTT